MSFVNFLLQTVIPIYIRPARNFGGIMANVTLEETLVDELEITQHPVQSGATISDHAFKKPIRITVKALWSDNGGPLNETYQALLDLQASVIPFTVVTGKRSVDNMLFKSLAETNDRETENILSVTAVFEEVIIVDVEVTTVPPRADQADPATTDADANAGAKSAQQANVDAVNSLFLGQGGEIQPPPVPTANGTNGLILGQ